MDFQQKEEVCRRILAAVGVSWGCPSGWWFLVEHMGEEAPGFMLHASKMLHGRGVTIVQRLVFSEDEFTVRTNADLIEAKVLRAYQAALIKVGEAE